MKALNHSFEKTIADFLRSLIVEIAPNALRAGQPGRRDRTTRANRHEKGMPGG